MDIGIVVIGRNEGERLRHCLESVCSSGNHVVYVDSGSTDKSVLIAKDMNVDVLELDCLKPFSAARARNEGFEQLSKQYPLIQYIQFIDGDCTLEPLWLEAGVKELFLNKNCAAVVGHLRELHPDQSIYNRLCSLEWKLAPVGDLTKSGGLGGISMMRVSIFQQLGGFNPKVIAGEEPELAGRMARKGFQITKVDHAMAKHDAEMHRFSQWWKRTVRSGHAISQRVYINASTTLSDGVRERNSVWWWGGILPLFCLILVTLTNGFSLLMLLVAYLILGVRVYLYYRKRDDNHSDALLYSFFIVLAKIPECIGTLKFNIHKSRNRYEIIEYK